MPTVSEVCEYLDQLAPAELAEDWDNVGLLVGRQSANVDRMLTCLTLTPDVAAEALEQGFQLVAAHHPILFRGTKTISDQTREGRMLLDLIEAGVAVYSAHTRFDSALQGINQRLAEGFGLTDIGVIRPSDSIPDSGSGRAGQLPESTSLKEFLGVVCAACKAPYVEYSGDGDARVGQVGVACGSAAEFLDDAVTLGCDTFVTGEARFHSVLEARSRGINLILMGHYSSERGAMEWLAEELGQAFPGLDLKASGVECDPLKLYR
jgi:dinuclear metal center YbgI/SA1388 family protein